MQKNQTTKSAGSAGQENDTAELRKHDPLIMFFDEHKKIRRVSSIAEMTELANDTARFRENE